MSGASEIVQTAREWLNTPFAHASAAKGLGADCLGLILGVAREVGLTEFRPPNYSRDIDPARLRAQMEQLVLPVAGGGQPGDVLLFRVRGLPIHLGYRSSSTHFIHAYEWIAGRGAVVETALDRVWRRQLVGAWRWPGVEGRG